MKWPQSEGADNFRRGLYIFRQRTLPYPQLETFDAPDNVQVVCKRDRSTTPLQALTLLNDPVFEEAALHLGKRIQREGGASVDERMRYAFRLCVSREPSAEELQRWLRTTTGKDRSSLRKPKHLSPRKAPAGPPPGKVQSGPPLQAFCSTWLSSSPGREPATPEMTRAPYTESVAPGALVGVASRRPGTEAPATCGLICLDSLGLSNASGRGATACLRFHLTPAVVQVLMICFIASASAFGQSTTGGVNGTITDTTGAVVPGTAVTLSNVETGVEVTTEANVSGFFVFVNVQPGNYTLVSEQTGFKSAVLPTFNVGVNQTVTQNIALEVGSVTETIEVMAQAEQLQQSTSELGTVIGVKEVEDLPLNGRNFTQLLTLTRAQRP